MKRIFIVILVLLLSTSLFSCISVVKELGEKNESVVAASESQEVVLTSNASDQPAKLASDKLQTYDEINRKYKTLHLKDSKHREDFSSDVVFANFRNVKLGNIKEGILYRGASSIDNSYGRAKYVDKLISEVGVKFDVDLTDNDDKIKRYFAKKISHQIILNLYMRVAKQFVYI